MSNAQQIYAEQVRSLFSLYGAEPFLDGTTTALQLAKDYAEVGEDCGLSLIEAVLIINKELAPYKDQLLRDFDDESERIEFNKSQKD